MTTYSIIRYFQNGSKKVLRKGLTLEEAQAHCARPETSSRTNFRVNAERTLGEVGHWYDGYQEECHVDFWGRKAERKAGLLESAIIEHNRLRGKS